LTNSYEIKAVDFTWEYVVVPWIRAVVVETHAGAVVNRLQDLTLQAERHLLKPLPALESSSPQKGLLFEELILTDWQ
jgi:hypothetical protein